MWTQLRAGLGTSVIPGGSGSPLGGAFEQAGTILAALERSTPSGTQIRVLLLEPQVHGGTWAAMVHAELSQFEAALSSDAEIIVDEGEVVLGARPLSFLRSVLESMPGRDEAEQRVLPELIQQILTERRSLVPVAPERFWMVPRLESVERLERFLEQEANANSDEGAALALGRWTRGRRNMLEEVLLTPLVGASLVIQSRDREHGRMIRWMHRAVSVALNLASSVERVSLRIDETGGHVELRAGPEGFCRDALNVLETRSTAELLSMLPAGVIAAAVPVNADAWETVRRRWIDPYFRRHHSHFESELGGIGALWAVLPSAAPGVEIGFEKSGDEPLDLHGLLRWLRESPSLGSSIVAADPAAVPVTEDSDVVRLGAVRGVDLPVFGLETPERVVLFAGEGAAEQAERERDRMQRVGSRSVWQLVPQLPDESAGLFLSSLPGLPRLLRVEVFDDRLHFEFGAAGT